MSWASSRTRRPVIAIGGLHADNLGDVVRAVALGLAVISELMKAARPDDAARRLCAAIPQASG